MARILLYQLDGSFPNLALMRISSHHKARGDTVRLKHAGNIDAVIRAGPEDYDKVYGSLLFKRSRQLAESIQLLRPNVILGGSGWDDIAPGTDDLVTITSRREASPRVTRLEDHGILTDTLDYSLYPSFEYSIGFTQRGCRMGCGFCDVPVKEGKVRSTSSVYGIWRGNPYPRKLILWDNDTFGNPSWRDVFREIWEGGFKVSFNQGVNCRLMNEENAAALARTACYNATFDTRRYYTAWDNRNDEQILFRGLNWLVKYGVKPDSIMVYMLIGYWPSETAADREYRRARLRDFGCRPYPMPYVRTKELVGFQRWVVGSYDKRISWERWQKADYRPERAKWTAW